VYKSDDEFGEKIISKINESKSRHDQLKKGQLKRDHSIQEFVSNKKASFTETIGQSQVVLLPETNERIPNSGVLIKKKNKFDLKIDTQSSSHDSSKLRDYSIAELFQLAEKKQFPKCEIRVGGSIKYRRPILNFFNFDRELLELPESIVGFECKACKWVTKQKLQEATYLNRHLRLHCKEKVKSWYKLYQETFDTNKTYISKETMLLIKYFITSNSSLEQMSNPYLLELLSNVPNIDTPGLFKFRHTFLPKTIDALCKNIAQKLDEAESVCIIVDLWSNMVNNNYLGKNQFLKNLYVVYFNCYY
jgi:hypothetical protein